MATWRDVDGLRWSALIDSMRPAIHDASTLEEAATVVCSRIAREIEGTALARVYAIIPYKHLATDVRAFVDALAHRTNQTEALTPETRVLALLGTYGEKEAWQSRRTSVGHQAIPLVSAAFVDAIPMLARLLKELGIDLAWLDAAPEVMTRKLLGGFNGIFYVEDAATVRDAKGRLVIPAADFVEQEGVKTVFGMGGTCPDGTVLATIVFTRETLTRASVERLSSLITMLKGETFRLVLGRRFFSG